MPDDSGLLTLDELPDGHEFTRAMWEGDTDWLDEHYGCGCCCHEHTFERSRREALGRVSRPGLCDPT